MEKKDKLTPIHAGPYEVVSHHDGDNAVQCKNLLSGTFLKPIHVDRLMVFVGDKDTALHEAKKNDNEYDIQGILGFTGDPTKRSTLLFPVKFQDNDEIWLPFNPNISNTEIFHQYILIHSYKPLQLLFGTEMAMQEIRKRFSNSCIDIPPQPLPLLRQNI